jgi:hypothetical protein
VLNQLRYIKDAAFNLTQLLAIAAPALIGIFWGAPLIGRELMVAWSDGGPLC